MSPAPRLVVGLLGAALLTAFVGPLVGLPMAAVLVGLAVYDARAVSRLPAVGWEVPAIVARGRPAPLAVRVGGGAAASGPLGGDPGPSAVSHLIPISARRVLIRQPFPAGVVVAPDRSFGVLEARITGRQRGTVELGPPVVRLEGRLGLGRWTHTVGGPRPVKVVADLPGARRLALEVRRGLRPGGSRSGRRYIGLGTDFEAVRDYLPDDDIRQVNWSATARTGRPMSNTYRIDQEREVICLLDAGRLMAAPAGDRTRLDAAVDAVCAVALVADQAGDRCGLTVFDEAIRAQLAPRRAGAPDVLDVASAAEVSLVDSRYDLAFQSIARRKRALVVLFTDLLDTYAARSLLAAVPIVVRRHAVVVAAVRDPDVAAVVERVPHDVGAAYETAVAVSMLADARRVAAHLTRAGAEVLTALPARLPVAAVDAYLRLKARARV